MKEADKLQPVSVKGSCETASTSENDLTDSAAAKAEKLGAQDEGAGKTESPVTVISAEEKDTATGTGMKAKEKTSLGQVFTDGKKAL